VDEPIGKTPEDLKALYGAGLLKNEKNPIYARQLERLTDPLRGLYENPEVGIKGHHEMMLTTDMCLAYKKNEMFSICHDNDKPIKDRTRMSSFNYA